MNNDDINLVLLTKKEIIQLYGLSKKFIALAEARGYLNPFYVGRYKKYKYEEVVDLVVNNDLNFEDLAPVKKSNIAHSKKQLMDTIKRLLKLIDKHVLYFNFHYKGLIDAELHEFLIDGKIFKETSDKVRRYTKYSNVYAPLKKKFSKINKIED